MDNTTPPSLTCPPPQRSTLREAALAHLARFGTTRQGLEQVLLRRVARWAQKAQRAGDCAEVVAEHAAGLRPVVVAVVDDMVRLGAVDDAVFARSRVRRLVRSGRSTRAVQAHLAAKGVAPEVREEALEEGVGTLGAGERELCAALVLARKRRLGPFATDPAEPDEDEASGMARQNRALGVLARAGFARDVAERVLEMQSEEAEDWMDRLRAES
ncbi:recombinase RecA [Acetobacter lambici]|uniref:Regulatory protein RecX n=2 Tax=Acetobacter lambici TaxID=1332824 RepID=A0ABT1EX30_9PROT|nr:RecX family transcriptional regulator [Acetobacter lambici]MCP1241933.1 RecX family transcriptional regulator [Acetobacter lambici]MCP1257448.1 RecX family transcriptional regulator [Acetobacter lambici]NHO56412.1 recombinase RecA [Acetobacter lambici]